MVQSLFYFASNSLSYITVSTTKEIKVKPRTKYVVPENINTPAPGKGNSERRGVQKEAISEGVEVASRVFSLGAPSKIDGQAISYYTVNLCFKAKSIVFIDTLLFAVS